MNSKAIKFTATQRTAIAAFIRDQLTSSQSTPLAVPTLKTPLIDQAKALGFSHREGQAIADLTIAKFQARADRITAAVRAAAEAKAAQEALLRKTISSAVTAQPDFMQAMSDMELKALVKSAGLRGTKTEVARALRLTLAYQARDAYTALYRVCCNGSVHAVARTTKRSAPVTPGVAQTTSTDWNLYRGAFKGWAADVLDTNLTLRADYWQQVEKTTGGVVEDCLVLDARLVRGVENLFHATWIQQGRGNQVSLVAGFVATGTAGAALGATAEQAMAKYAKQLKKAA